MENFRAHTSLPSEDYVKMIRKIKKYVLEDIDMTPRRVFFKTYKVGD